MKHYSGGDMLLIAFIGFILGVIFGAIGFHNISKNSTKPTEEQCVTLHDSYEDYLSCRDMLGTDYAAKLIEDME